MKKKVIPLPESRAGRVCSDRFTLTELTWGGRDEVFIWRKVGLTEGVTLINIERG